MGTKSLLSIFTTSLLLAAAPAWASSSIDLIDLSGWPYGHYSSMSENGYVVGNGTDNNTQSESYLWKNGNLISLGFLPGGSFSEVAAISNDGSVIIGWGINSNGDNEAFHWENGVMTGLGFLPGGSSSYPSLISHDGTVIAGNATNGNGFQEVFRWENGVMTGLGFLGTGTYSNVSAMSADGSVIVGSSEDSNHLLQAFRWENGTMTGLGFLGTGNDSEAYAISADGLVIGGYSKNSSGYDEAFRWENGVMTGLGFLGAGHQSGVGAINADGSVLIGTAENSDGYTEAFRWENGVMTGLGILGTGTQSVASNMTPDGSILVGYSESSPGVFEAIRWTQATGMQSLSSILSAEGVDMTGWALQWANGINDDGNLIAGQGTYNGNAALFLINMATGGLTTPDDLANSLNTAAQASQQVNAATMQYAPQGIFAAENLDTISAPISIAMNRSPEDISPAAGDFETVFSAFILGSYGIGQNNDTDNDQWNGTIGISAEVAQDMHLGIGFIVQNSHLELDFDGESDMDAYGGIGLFAYEPGEEGLRVYATGYAADLSLEVERGYLNGSGLDSSRGDTDGVSYGGAVKFGWEKEIAYALTAMPYIEGRYSKTKLDAYSETGGAFAANFSKQDSNYAASRIGVELNYKAKDNLELLLRPAWGHRLSGDGGSFTADVGGLSQSLSPDAGDRNWMELSIGAKYQATNKVKFTTELTGRSGDTGEPMGTLRVGSSVRF